MRTPIVAGNWKMNGNLAANRQLVDGLRSRIDGPKPVQRLVCVPFPYLYQVQQLLAGSDVLLGAQDVSEHEKGAYTGEVSASMLLEFGCTHVIVGHSERRARHGETSEQVARKVKAALAAGLTPVVCVGETLQERDAGQAEQVVEAQLRAVLDVLSHEELARCVLAYEPVWAIGTGRTATPEQAQDIHAALRAVASSSSPEAGASLRILYGGSVKGDNAAELFQKPDIDGALVGGASLVAEDFAAIVQAAQSRQGSA